MIIYDKSFSELTKEEILKRQKDCKDMIMLGNLWSDSWKYIFRNRIFLSNVLKKLQVINLTEEEIKTMEIAEEYIPKQVWRGRNKERGSRCDVFASINGKRNIDLEIQRLIRGDEEGRILYSFSKLIVDRNPGEQKIGEREHICVWIFQSDISKQIGSLSGYKSLPYYTFSMKYESPMANIEGIDESFHLTNGDKIILINGGYDWNSLGRDLTEDEEAIRSFILDMGEYEIENIRDEVSKEVMKEYMDEIYDSDLLMTMALEMDETSKAMLERREREARIKGKREGETRIREKTIKSMLSYGLSSEQIAVMTGYHHSEVEKVAKEVK